MVFFRLMILLEQGVYNGTSLFVQAVQSAGGYLQDDACGGSKQIVKQGKGHVFVDPTCFNGGLHDANDCSPQDIL